MKFSKVGSVEEVVWMMRLAELPRAENRRILQELYNGAPPYSQAEAEENSIQVNRSFLEGSNLLAQARRQWNRAFMGGGNYFNVNLDSGPAHKRREWSHTITRNLNRRLKRNKAMMEQVRATGANVMLYGIGPVSWSDRRRPIPKPLPVASLMIPSETDIDFENVEYFAVFREWTPAQLYNQTHGKKVDAGWNMDAVRRQLDYVGQQVQKQPNATAFQYMPERVEELVKQDLGFFGSDAVPTIDVWEFYFRERDEGDGWYRRVFCDWDVTQGSYDEKSPKPATRNESKEMGGFLYSSGERKYANSLNEILHCQFGDCSAYAPFKYHSVRALGWMLWGVCDLQNRLRCKFSEAVFEQLMWFFRTSGEQDMARIKKAILTHMGVIPNGVSFVPSNERFKPDFNTVAGAIGMNRQIMSENAAAFTQEPDNRDKETTATETMAKVNAVNALVSGMLALAYEYETHKDREIARRFCIKGNPYADARAFRLSCLRDGVPPELLDAERWDVQPERVMGGGNKTLEIAQSNQLLGMRKFLGPQAQRQVDHIAIEAFTDDPSLAERLAPEGKHAPPPSAHDAQLATDRLLRGLEFQPSPEMVPEEYVKVWLHDLATLVGRAQKQGGMATPEQIQGFGNLAQHVKNFLALMEQNDEDKPRVKQYADALGKIENFIKAFAQRLAAQAKAAAKKNAQGNGVDPKAMAQLKGKMLIDKAKADNMRESHALRTGQKQVAFELQQQREAARHEADLKHEHAAVVHDLAHNRLKALSE